MNNTYDLTEISDDYMNERLANAKEYTLLILRTTSETFKDSSVPTIREHGRRNMALQASGVLAIVCPVAADRRSGLAGIGIFAAPADEVRGIMDGDPAVDAGVLEFDVHPIPGFPGDCLPG
jgi:hypothetical protein